MEALMGAAWDRWESALVPKQVPTPEEVPTHATSQLGGARR